MTDAYLEGRLDVSLHMMEMATDLSAKLAHKGLARAYAARLEARALSRAMQPTDDTAHD